MSSKHIRTDVNFAWPTAEIAVMGPEGAVNIVYKRELERAAGKTSVESKHDKGKWMEEVRKEKIEEFRERFANPYVAAERGYIDSVIQPRETRKRVIDALEMLQTKRDKNPPKKHGNIPL
jgi:propionyl-CoA carboxylase beta chain